MLRELELKERYNIGYVDNIASMSMFGFLNYKLYSKQSWEKCEYFV